MNYFDEYLYKYGLHDCKLNKMEIKNGILHLYFDQGVYELDERGKEISLTGSCTVMIELSERFTELEAKERIEIVKISKRKKFEIDYEVFKKRVDRFGFDIIINYYSYFCNTIMMKGYMKSDEYEITIPMVKKVSFKEDSSMSSSVKTVDGGVPPVEK